MWMAGAVVTSVNWKPSNHACRRDYLPLTVHVTSPGYLASSVTSHRSVTSHSSMTSHSSVTSHITGVPGQLSDAGDRSGWTRLPVATASRRPRPAAQLHPHQLLRRRADMDRLAGRRQPRPRCRPRRLQRSAVAVCFQVGDKKYALSAVHTGDKIATSTFCHQSSRQNRPHG